MPTVFVLLLTLVIWPAEPARVTHRKAPPSCADLVNTPAKFKGTKVALAARATGVKIGAVAGKGVISTAWQCVTGDGADIPGGAFATTNPTWSASAANASQAKEIFRISGVVNGTLSVTISGNTMTYMYVDSARVVLSREKH